MLKMGGQYERTYLASRSAISFWNQRYILKRRITVYPAVIIDWFIVRRTVPLCQDFLFRLCAHTEGPRRRVTSREGIGERHVELAFVIGARESVGS
jgi:hypothetical protein